jgi:hypothetical protein
MPVAHDSGTNTPEGLRDRGRTVSVTNYVHDYKVISDYLCECQNGLFKLRCGLNNIRLNTELYSIINKNINCKVTKIRVHTFKFHPVRPTKLSLLSSSPVRVSTFATHTAMNVASCHVPLYLSFTTTQGHLCCHTGRQGPRDCKMGSKFNILS